MTKGETLILIAIAVLAFGDSGSAATVQADEPDDDPPPDDTPPQDKPKPDNKPKPDIDQTCETGEAYAYDGEPLGVPSASTYAKLEMPAAELSAAMTVLTRVINETYVPPTGACTRQGVAKLAAKGTGKTISLNANNALAVLAWWKVKGEVRPYPSLDPALSTDAMAVVKAMELESVKRLKSFMVYAMQAQTKV